MSTTRYPRSPKEQLGGLCHLGRLIDKVRLHHAGKLEGYNYLTIGFDKYLLDRLQIRGEDLEKRVLQGGTDAEILQWVEQSGKALSPEEKAEWNQMVFTLGPRNEQAQKAFDACVAGIAKKRGVSVDQLPKMTTWLETIEVDEGRM